MTKRMKATVMGLVAVVAAATVAFVVFGQGAREGGAADQHGLLARIAAHLGVGADELREAFIQARMEMIDEAVAAGRITEEQAQEMKDRIEARQALRGVFDQAIEEGKITQDQLALLRGRMGGMTGRDGAVPRGRAIAGRIMGRMTQMMDRKCPCR